MILILGIFIGMLAGSVLTIWYVETNKGEHLIHQKMPKYISKMFSSKTDTISRIPIIVPKVNKEIENKLPAQQKEKLPPDTIQPADSLPENLRAIADDAGIKRDSLVKDSAQLTTDPIAEREEIVVVKDELIFAKTIRVSGLDSIAKREAMLDSLLIDELHPSLHLSSIFRIEFWISPVNYTGYKMSNKKLILFGIYDFEHSELVYDMGQFFLLTSQKDYRLEISEKFRALEPLKEKYNKS